MKSKKGLFVILSTIRIDSSGCVREWHICDVDVFHVTPKSGGKIIGRHFYYFICCKRSYLIPYSHSLKDYKTLNIIGVMSETLSIAKPDADEDDDNFRIPTSLAC